MRPFTRADFDQQQCTGCANHGQMLVVMQACHPRAGLKLHYQESEAGVLEVYCYLCEKLVVRIQVA